MPEYTEAESIAVLARATVPPVVLEPGQIYARVNEGEVVVDDTDDYAEKPRRVIRSATVRDADSFLSYVEQRQADRSGFEVWADVEKLTVTGVLDGHDGWRGDQVRLQLQYSPEWKAWTALSGKLQAQLEFADFVEDQLSAIAEPDGAALLEIIQSMQGTTKVAWQSADWLDNGARAFQWVEEVDAKAGRRGKLEIPSKFTLALRPFVGSDPFKVVANLRYRIEHGLLRVGFKLPELGRVVEQAFDDVLNTVAAGVSVEIIAGQPS
ncbi:DUF2303 family protein [Micropruina sp.]|uniref:DUF2303 family protein n=1 Tax=Micropruina sp. TaxID=2737536 RepID=UPI0039E63BA4